MTEIVIVGIVIVISLLLNTVLQKLVIRLRKRSARNRAVNQRIFLNNIQNPLKLWVVLGTIYGIGSYFKLDDIPVLVYLLSASLVTIIITFVYVLYRAVQSIIQYYIRKGRLPNTTIFNTLTAIVTILIGITLILASLGISITPIVAAFGIGGLAIALALQPTLANLFAGISIIASKQINPGDFVELSSTQAGYIEDIQWRTTSIRTVHNNMIIIPNSIVSNLIITNYSLPKQDLAVVVPVGVHYESDLEHVKRVCLEVAADVMMSEEEGVKEEEPVVRFRNFGASSIDLNVILRAKEYAGQHHIRSEFIQRLMKRFREENIIIPYPITTLEFAEGHRPQKE
ncbi:MAG: mechanosensitive ion channel family protein [Candidatus Kariarchaeaceae archaeon]